MELPKPGVGMPWVETRVVGGHSFRYVVWRVRVRAEDGTLRWKRQSKPVGRVPLEVAQVRAQEVGLVELGQSPRPKHIGPLAALDAFLAEWSQVKRRRPATITFYRGRLTPIFRALSDRGPLRSWQARWVVEYLAERPGWSARTIQMHITALRTFARWARRRGYDCPDFARDVEGPRVPKPQRAAYSAAELRTLLAAVEGRRLAAAVHLAALAGLSLGDLRRLRWADIDLRGGWIVADRSKTGRPMRIPIGKRLRAFLEALPAGGLADPVCALPGKDAAVYRSWTRLCAKAGVPHIGGMKRLRHTYATLLDAARVDTATRRDLMAHAPGSRMADHYTHADSARLRAGIAAIDRAVS